MSDSPTDDTEESYTVRLERDGPASWSNASGLEADRTHPLIRGLSQEQATALVANHPFESAGDPLVSATSVDSGPTEGRTSPDYSEGPTTPAPPAADPDTSTESNVPDDREFGADVDDTTDPADTATDDVTGDTDLQSINGVGPATATKLSEAGYETVDEVTSLTQAELEAAGVAEHSAKRISKQG